MICVYISDGVLSSRKSTTYHSFWFIVVLATNHIDNVYVTVPANAIAHIGLSTHSSDTEPGTTSESEAGTPSKETSNLDIELDPERAKYAEDMISLWNCLSKMKPVESLGLCDVETDIFKKIYNEVQIKPKNVQVNILFRIYIATCILLC